MSDLSSSSQEIQYDINGKPYTGYLALPDGNAEPQPCVIVVHEWWGHNDYARRRARMLADAGYVAFALDMYGAGKTASTPAEAGALMQALMDEEGAILERFEGALAWVKNNPHVDSNRIAAIGYCFGGAVVLNMARAGLDLAAVASFHGFLATDNPVAPGQIKGKVAAFHGNDDAMVGPDQVSAFKSEMEAAGVDYLFVGYDGTTHGFTNPQASINGEKYGLPLAHNPQADADSWQQMLKLLEEAFA
ncbi:MAG: dienelactone hydrolase family protein [bacterium]